MDNKAHHDITDFSQTSLPIVKAEVLKWNGYKQFKIIYPSIIYRLMRFHLTHSRTRQNSVQLHTKTYGRGDSAINQTETTLFDLRKDYNFKI
jgi:hypothetical protein